MAGSLRSGFDRIGNDIKEGFERIFRAITSQTTAPPPPRDLRKKGYMPKVTTNPIRRPAEVNKKAVRDVSVRFPMSE